MNDQPIDNDPGNLTLEKFEAFVNSLDQPNAEQLKKARLTLGALISDKPNLTQSASVYNTARVLMQASLLHVNPALAPYIEQINEDAREMMYIEHCRKAYGDEMVNAALDDARTSYRTFYHSMQLRIMAKQFETSFGALRETFAQLGQRIGEQLTRGFAGVPCDAPNNRHTRRSSKHKRQIKEGDQLWARRNNHKRRR